MRMSELAMDAETARNISAPEHDIGMDVTQLLSVTASLVAHSRKTPDFVARDRDLISDAYAQLGKMLSRLSVTKDAAE